jgi:hypothetical protein
MTDTEQLAQLTKNQRRFLSRRVCAFCELPLHRAGCGAVYYKCPMEARIARREDCLKAYRPRTNKITQS